MFDSATPICVSNVNSSVASLNDAWVGILARIRFKRKGCFPAFTFVNGAGNTQRSARVVAVIEDQQQVSRARPGHGNACVWIFQFSCNSRTPRFRSVHGFGLHQPGSLPQKSEQRAIRALDYRRLPSAVDCSEVLPVLAVIMRSSEAVAQRKQQRAIR